MNPKPRRALSTMGWREWISLPALGVELTKAKVDTGARTSALHAADLEIQESSSGALASFTIFPIQRSRTNATHVRVPVARWRHVRSSSGHATLRPVIVTEIAWQEHCWEVEFTLTSRDAMGFRLLLGRQALRGRAVVDPARSFLDRERRRQARTVKAKRRSRRPKEG